jgi:hypothetical protein
MRGIIISLDIAVAHRRYVRQRNHIIQVFLYLENRFIRRCIRAPIGSTISAYRTLLNLSDAMIYNVQSIYWPELQTLLTSLVSLSALN